MNVSIIENDYTSSLISGVILPLLCECIVMYTMFRPLYIPSYWELNGHFKCLHLLLCCEVVMEMNLIIEGGMGSNTKKFVMKLRQSLSWNLELRT